jgi:hypothetical protein
MGLAEHAILAQAYQALASPFDFFRYSYARWPFGCRAFFLLLELHDGIGQLILVDVALSAAAGPMAVPAAQYGGVAMLRAP